MDVELRQIKKIQKKGNTKEADLLIRAYYDEIYIFVYKQLSHKDQAMDITQEIFISPFFYIFSYKISEWKERQMRTNQLFITCKYTLKHLTAFRMLCFGGIGALLNVLICLVVYEFNTNLNFFKLLMVSFCSLILYSAVYLILINFNPVNITSFQSQKWNLCNWMPVLWCAGNAWLFLVFDKEAEEYLLHLSFGLEITVLLILIILYLFQIQLFLMNTRKEENTYVSG